MGESECQIHLVGKRSSSVLRSICLCALKFYLWSSVLAPGQSILKGVCGNTYQSSRVVCGNAHLVMPCWATSKLQNIFREREQRTVLDLVGKRLRRVFSILPAPVELSKQLTTVVRSLLKSVRHAILCAFSRLAHVVGVICQYCHPVSRLAKLTQVMWPNR